MNRQYDQFLKFNGKDSWKYNLLGNKFRKNMAKGMSPFEASRYCKAGTTYGHYK